MTRIKCLLRSPFAWLALFLLGGNQMAAHMVPYLASPPPADSARNPFWIRGWPEYVTRPLEGDRDLATVFAVVVHADVVRELRKHDEVGPERGGGGLGLLRLLVLGVFGLGRISVIGGQQHAGLSPVPGGLHAGEIKKSGVIAWIATVAEQADAKAAVVPPPDPRDNAPKIAPVERAKPRTTRRTRAKPVAEPQPEPESDGEQQPAAGVGTAGAATTARARIRGGGAAVGTGDPGDGNCDVGAGDSKRAFGHRGSGFGAHRAMLAEDVAIDAAAATTRRRGTMSASWRG